MNIDDLWGREPLRPYLAVRVMTWREWLRFKLRIFLEQLKDRLRGWFR